MRYRYASCTLVAAAAVLVMLAFSTAAQAQLLYSFESPAVNPDGFGPNGGGITVTQDVIGATNGLHSMNDTIVAGATFVGALTTQLPAQLNGSPLPVQSVQFDYTIVTPFVGNFAVAGITMFGFNGPLGQFGLQAQFADIEHFEGKAPGTYTATIDLTSATNPLTFATGQSYNDIFTSGTPDASHLNPSGFQIFFNKSNDAPLTVYIDNVRLVQVPEPASIATVTAGLGLLMVRRRRQA